MIKDPEITTKDALLAFDNNQSKLASALGVSRAAISDWKKRELKLIPAISAYRLLNAYPEKFTHEK